MKKILLFISLIVSLAGMGQNIFSFPNTFYDSTKFKSQVKIGTGNIAPSAALDITSTTKGILFPRMTTTQQDAISSPANGLVVYNTDTAAVFYYNGSAWTKMGSGSSGGLSDGDKGDITVSSSGTVWTIDNGAVSNAKLANSTISGVSLGSSLAALTAGNSTITLSGSYDGSTARTAVVNESGLTLDNIGGTLSVSKGGTGATTLTGVLIGNGTSAVNTKTNPSGAFVGTTDAQTMTNKRWTPRVGSTTSSATPTINTDNVDIYKLTAQAADITSFTTNLSGTPVDGDILEIQITGTATRAITWGSSFVSSTVTLPTTTNSTATLTVVLQYFTTSSYGNNKWVCANSF